MAVLRSATDRTQPGLPLKNGRAGTRGFSPDCKRHLLPPLFAAMYVLDGTVIGRNMAALPASGVHPLPQRRRARGSARKTLHAILDNYAAHKHPAVWRWLRAIHAQRSTSRRPRPLAIPTTSSPS